jgi:hypothetical protein
MRGEQRVFTPRGITLLLGDKVHPRGPTSPLEAKVKTESQILERLMRERVMDDVIISK